MTVEGKGRKGKGRRGEAYVVLKAGFRAEGEAAGRLLSTAWLFRLAVGRVLAAAQSAEVLPEGRVGWREAFYRTAYSAVPNARYAEGAVFLVMQMYESVTALGVDFRSVRLKEGWLLFQQGKREWPAWSATLKSADEAVVTTVGYDGSSRRIPLRIKAFEPYRSFLEAVVRERQPYQPRVVLRGPFLHRGQLHIDGELHVAIPLEFYHRHAARYKENRGRLVGGVDVNADRLNLAIVDGEDRLRGVKTFWFPEVTAHGTPRERAWRVIGMRIHELLRYAYHHGVAALYLEDPQVLGALRLAWIRNGSRGGRNYNWKVSTFRSSVIERIAAKAPLYAIRVGYVSPRGTTRSEEHDQAARRLGLDRHSASAYLIAVRGLRGEEKREEKKKGGEKKDLFSSPFLLPAYWRPATLP